MPLRPHLFFLRSPMRCPDSEEGRHDDETNGYPSDEIKNPMKTLVKKADYDSLGDDNDDLDQISHKRPRYYYSLARRMAGPVRARD